MKLTTIIASLLAYFSLTSALLSLSYEPTSDDRDLSLNLNKIENEKWSTEATAFENLRQQAGDGEVLFEIPEVKTNKVYAFTLNTTSIDGTGAAEGDRTENFMINKKGYVEKKHVRDFRVKI